MNEFTAGVVEKTAGERLIADLSKDGDKYELTVLIVEAGRVADRLEKLNAILTGQQTEWTRLREDRSGDLIVFVDGALAEARQQATVLRQLVVEIQRQRALKPKAPVADDLDGI